MIFLVLIALVLIGPRQLPEAARNIARFINEMKRASSGMWTEFENSKNHIHQEVKKEIVFENKKSEITPEKKSEHRSAGQSEGQDV